MYNLLGHITEDRSEDKDEKDIHLKLDFEDEITSETCIAHEGEIRQAAIREALEGARSGAKTGDSEDGEAG
jgi:H+-translocating NAD(P) transhydrogenase subunit alpha